MSCVDMTATRKNMKQFLLDYRSAREASIQQAPEKSIQQNDCNQQYTGLHQQYIKGMAAVQHHNPTKTKRRREAFYYRYVLGYPPPKVAASLCCSITLIEKELSAAIVQFCEALEIVTNRRY